MPKVQIRVDLDGEAAEKFLSLKKRLGLSSNAEVVRYLISFVYDEIAGRGLPLTPDELKRFDEWEKKKTELLNALTKPEIMQMLLAMQDEIKRLSKIVEELQKKREK